MNMTAMTFLFWHPDTSAKCEKCIITSFMNTNYLHTNKDKIKQFQYHNANLNAKHVLGKVVRVLGCDN